MSVSCHGILTSVSFNGPKTSLFVTPTSSQQDTFQPNHPSFLRFNYLGEPRLNLMSTPASQLMLRHGRLFARKTTIRHASTTAEAAQAASNTLAKSKEIASEVTSKASDGLTRVQSSSGTALSRVARGVNRTFGAIGNRAGRLIVFSTCECAQFFHLAGTLCDPLIDKRSIS